MKKYRSGFTLIEMMVVIVIIGLLTAVFVARMVTGADKAKVKTTEAIISQLDGEIQMFKLDHNRYPRQLEELVIMPSDIDPKKWPPGGYRKKPALDGWGKDFVYRVPGTGGQPYDLISYGEDGREGGEGYAEDIWNHSSGKK